MASNAEPETNSRDARRREQNNRNQINSRASRRRVLEDTRRELTDLQEEVKNHEIAVHEEIKRAARRISQDHLRVQEDNLRLQQDNVHLRHLNSSHDAMYHNVREYLFRLGRPEAEINQLLDPTSTVSNLPRDHGQALRQHTRALEAHRRALEEATRAMEHIFQARRLRPPPRTQPPSTQYYGLPMPPSPHLISCAEQGIHQPPVAQQHPEASVIPMATDRDAHAAEPASFPPQRANSWPHTTAALVQPQLEYSYDNSIYHGSLPSANPNLNPAAYSNPPAHSGIGGFQQTYSYAPPYQPQIQQQATPQWQHATSGPLAAPMQPQQQPPPPTQPYVVPSSSSAPATFSTTAPSNPF